MDGPVGGGVKLYVLHKLCVFYSLAVDLFLYHNRFIYCLKFDDNKGATIATTHKNGVCNVSKKKKLLPFEVRDAALIPRTFKTYFDDNIHGGKK